MSEPTPTPTAPDLPAPRCIGIVREDEGRARLMQGLHALGLSAGVSVSCTRDVTHTMHPAGPDPTHWRAMLQSDEQLATLASQSGEYEAAALDGASIVSVQLASADQREAVRDLFARCGGQAVRYVGALGADGRRRRAPTAERQVKPSDGGAAPQGHATEQAARQDMVWEGSPVVPGKPTS